MKRLLTGLLLIASAVAVFAAPPTIKWTWATTNAPSELTNIVQAIAGTADASLPTNVVTRADTSGIIFTNTAGERITLLPSEDLGSNATVYLPGDLTPADGSISTNKLDATAIAWIDSQGDGTMSGGSYDTNEITMTAVLADTTPVPVWTNSIASNRVHYVEARLAWAGVGGTNNAEDFLVARVSRDNTGVVNIGSTNSFTAIRTAAGHDAVTLAGESYLSLGGQQITAAAINLDTHTTGTLPEAKVHADIARDSEIVSATAPKQDTNSSLSSLISLTLQMPHIAGTLGSNIFLGSGSDVMEQQEGNIHHASRNIVIGWDSLTNNRTGYYNWSIGWENLRSNLTGSGNVAIGGHALEQQTNGWDNIGIGDGAGQSNVTSSVNVFAGHLAGVSLRGSGTWGDTIGRNVFLGYEADVTPDGSIEWNLTNATAIGAQAKVTKSNQAVIGGPYNTEVLLNGSIVANAPGNNIRLVSNDGTDDMDGFVGAYSGGLALANWDFTRGLSIATNGVISGVGSSVLADGIIPSAITRDSELADYFKLTGTNQFALDILSAASATAAEKTNGTVNAAVKDGSGNTITSTYGGLAANNVFSGSNYFTGPVVVDNGNNTSTFHDIVVSGTITGDLSGATNLPSTSITGVIPMANIATGSYTGTQFVRGDGTLADPPTSGGTSSVTWDSSNLILTLTDVVLSSLAWDTDNLIFTATY